MFNFIDILNVLASICRNYNGIYIDLQSFSIDGSMLSVSKEFYLHSTILIKTGSVKWGYFGPKVAIFITIFCQNILFSKVSPYIFL